MENKKKTSWEIPKKILLRDKLMRLISSFNLTEKVIFGLFSVLLFISAITLLYRVNKIFTVEVPDYGGSLTEGIIGTPRFVNPLLAVSDIDRDMTSLVYSGLLRSSSDNSLIPDLASACDVSDNGLVYTCALKPAAKFQDGVMVTADDVLFTVGLAQDPTLGSPRKTNWDGVKAEKVDMETIRFTLKQPYAPFMQNLTLGILPKHIWKNISSDEFPFSQYNLKPVGSGPYKIESVSFRSSGLPSEYHLTSNSSYLLGRPYITNIFVSAFENEKALVDAYKNGTIESMYGVAPKQISSLQIAKDNIILSPLPRVFGIFFNQNAAPVFVNKEVRMALNAATDKEDIVDKVLSGYGQTINEPVPPDTLGTPDKTRDDKVAIAKSILEKAGWKQNALGVYQKTDKKSKSVTALSFSISTGDAPELRDAAYLIQKEWQAVGADVSVKIFETSDLNQNIIRPRKYDALLFGEVVGSNTDLYPFWHSSARVSPGLNIALYANVKADKLLEQMRKTTDSPAEQNLYNQFNKEISNDLPAVFTYSPYFIYVMPSKVHDVQLGNLNTASERFSDVYHWYIETNNVWKIFQK